MKTKAYMVCETGNRGRGLSVRAKTPQEAARRSQKWSWMRGITCFTVTEIFGGERTVVGAEIRK